MGIFKILNFRKIPRIDVSSRLKISFKNLMIIESDTEIAIKISIEYDIRYLIVTLLCDDILKRNLIWIYLKSWILEISIRP